MEYFDILNIDGSKRGIKKERTAVHKDGDLHGSVHIWVIRDNQVLLQKRSMCKDSYPGFYDASCTGHIDFGENPETAAMRELSEELNIKTDMSSLNFITQIHVNEKNVFHDKVFINNELTNVYLLNGECDLSTLDFQTTEIDELLWMECDTLKNDLLNENSQRKYCLSLDEFRIVLKYIADNN